MHLKWLVPRRKSLGNKRNDITTEDREIIVKAYGEFKNTTYTLDGKVCESKIFNNEDFGYNRIQIETPSYDEDGNILTKGKQNKPVADTSKRDYENVPLVEDIDSYFNREVKPYNSDAWIEKNKTKVGYEIPFTRYFYKYQVPEKSEVIEERLKELELNISESLEPLFGMEGSI